MLCRGCGQFKTQVMRTTDYGVVILRYRICSSCGRVFQTAEEEYGALESTISLCRLKAISKQHVKEVRDAIRVRTTSLEGVTA